MKGKVVPALRSKRGLRRGCGAEPPGCEPQCEQQFRQHERKADTMKTYLLKNASVVEPKAAPKTARPPRLPKPSAPAPGPVLFLGMDVHNDSIAVSLAPSGSSEVRRYGVIGGSHDDVLKLCRRLQGAHPDATLKFCYEAGPRGYLRCATHRSDAWLATRYACGCGCLRSPGI